MRRRIANTAAYCDYHPMSNGITRRDFMNGIAIAVAGAAGIDVSRASAADDSTAQNYPPGRSGLRGSHVGSFEAAHRLRDGSPFDLSQASPAEPCDLVVVGAGLSGLAAAHFYRQRRPNARVLIHQPHGGAQGQSIDIENQAREIAFLRGRIEQLLSQHTGQPIERIAKDTDRDYILGAADAIAYGLVDEVLLPRAREATLAGVAVPSK